MGVEFSTGAFFRSFEQGASLTVSRLPRLSDPRIRIAVLMDVAALVDTKCIATNGRLKELAEFAGLHGAEVDDAVHDFDEVNELTSDASGLAGGLAAWSLSDMFSHVHQAQAAAVAAFENDPFAVQRQKRRALVTKSAVAVGTAALTFFTGGVGDFLLVAAAPIVHATLGNPRDVQSIVKVSKAMKAAAAGADPRQRQGTNAR